MFLLEPLWQTNGRFSALLAHCPADSLPSLARALADSPLVSMPCYCPTRDGHLPVNLPLPHTLRPAALTPLDPSDNPIPQLLPFGAALPEGPLLVSGVSTSSEIASLGHRNALICGPWMTAALDKTEQNPTQPVLLELLSLIVRDAESTELEKVFAKAPQLTVSLLRLVNSVGVGGHRHTESIHQAIALIGRRQLQRWLQLLLYAEQYGPHAKLPPLFIAAALRAKRMEQWVRADWFANLSPDTAFMAGMLSLLDKLFGQTLASILAPLPLAPEITAGLLYHEGEIGEALTWLQLAEAGASETLADRIRIRGCDRQQWQQTEIDALGWVYALTEFES